MSQLESIIGIGGGGGNFLSSLKSDQYLKIALNSDIKALEFVDADYKWSTFGESEKDFLDNLNKMVHIVMTLGGESNNASMLSLLNFLKSSNKEFSITVTMPFYFEDRKRIDTAKNFLKKIVELKKDINIIENSKFVIETSDGIHKIFDNINNEILKYIKNSRK